MSLPSVGAISANTVSTEYGGFTPHSLTEYYRGGAYVLDTLNTTNIPTSGELSLSDFYNSSSRVLIPLTISSPTYNYNTYTNRGPSYVAGISDLVVTINSGVVVGSTDTSGYSIRVPNSFTAGDTVTIINNGLIQGAGGAGGASIYDSNPGNPGLAGGSAVYANFPTTIQNNGTIASGGGGGGSGGGGHDDKGPARRGGGGGGGAGTSGGPGGAGPSGGSPGTSTAGGAGGNGDASDGGAGGGRGASGATGPKSGGANPNVGGAGGTAGYYIVGNPFVTWSAVGTRQGLVG